MRRVTIGDIAEIVSGGTPSRSNGEYWGGTIPWIKTGAIDYCWIREADELITEKGLENSAARIIPNGTILMAMYGQGKTRGQVAILGIDAAINQACAAILLRDGYDRDFVYQQLVFRYGHIRKLSNSGSQDNLNADLVRSIAFPTPDEREQKKIGAILSCWDKATDELGMLVSAKVKRKRGLMQKLLTGKTRFKEFKGERWRKVRLSEVLEQVVRRNPTGCHRVLTGSAEHGLIDQREYYSRRVASDDVSGYYLVKRGEFAYNRSSAGGYPFGATKRLDDYDEGALSTLYLVFRIRNKTPVDSNFLDHMHESGLFNAQLSRLCREGARSHGLLNITADEYFSMHLDLPSIAEQRRIEAALSACDEEIKLLEKQLEALKEQKRGLMQKLLTGEVRVKPQANAKEGR